MLDARADGEGLLHERDAARQKRFERIAGAVADGEHDGLGGQLVSALRVIIANGGDMAALCSTLVNRAPKCTSPPNFENAHAHGFDHAAELICADVRLCVDENVMRRAETDESAQNMFAARVFRAGVELAVGERARAALAELHVGRRGESLRTARPVSVNVAGADIHILTALSTMGHAPASASVSAANSPAGPKPTTIGRTAGARSSFITAGGV